MSSLDHVDLSLVTGARGPACAVQTLGRGIIYGAAGGAIGSVIPGLGTSAGFTVGFLTGAGEALVTSPHCFGRRRNW
jgi:hypothetical protein